MKISHDWNVIKSEIDDCANVDNKNDRNRKNDVFIGYIMTLCEN